jgi:hypothetical protein
MYASGSTSSPLMLMHAEANWPLELQPPPEAAGEALSAPAAAPATYMARFSTECPGALARGVDASACPAATPEMAMAAAAIAAVRRMSMLIVM